MGDSQRALRDAIDAQIHDRLAEQAARIEAAIIKLWQRTPTDDLTRIVIHADHLGNQTAAVADTPHPTPFTLIAADVTIAHRAARGSIAVRLPAWVPADWVDQAQRLVDDGTDRTVVFQGSIADHPYRVMLDWKPRQIVDDARAALDLLAETAGVSADAIAAIRLAVDLLGEAGNPT